MHFYFLRHGKTQAHVDKLICGGGWNIELTKEGLSLAQNTAAQSSEKLADVKRIAGKKRKKWQGRFVAARGFARL